LFDQAVAVLAEVDVLLFAAATESPSIVLLLRAQTQYMLGSILLAQGHFVSCEAKFAEAKKTLLLDTKKANEGEEVGDLFSTHYICHHHELTCRVHLSLCDSFVLQSKFALAEEELVALDKLLSPSSLPSALPPSSAPSAITFLSPTFPFLTPKFDVSAELLTTKSALACSKGQYSKSRSLSQEALDKKRLLYSSCHPRVALSMAALADLSIERNDYREAEESINEAIDMLNLFAMTSEGASANGAASYTTEAAAEAKLKQQQQPQLQQQQQLQQQKGGFEEDDGDKYPCRTLDMSFCLLIKGKLHRDLSHFKLASEAAAASLRIALESLGPLVDASSCTTTSSSSSPSLQSHNHQHHHHHAVASILFLLAEIDRDSGNFLHAKRHFEAALAIRTQCFSSTALFTYSGAASASSSTSLTSPSSTSLPLHPHITSSLAGAASALVCLGKYEHALSLFHQVLAMFQGHWQWGGGGLLEVMGGQAHAQAEE